MTAETAETAEEKALQWERKADDLEPMRQSHLVQADISLRSAGNIGMKQGHQRAIADLIRSEGMPRMTRLRDMVPDVGKELTGAEARPYLERRRSA